MNIPRSLPRHTVLALAIAGIPVCAFGQSDVRHIQPTDLDAVIVRSSPLPRTAEDLTRPVEVLVGERLDALKASSLGETVNQLPGVQSSYFGPGVGRPIIRGLDGARVQVLNDGLASGDVSTVSVDHAVSIEPFLANQIEVLKGPSTLLYGSGAIGGAVNVIDGRIPERATQEPLEGRAELRAGSVADEKTGMVRLDGTSASGNVVFHFDALHRETGNYKIPGYAELESHDDHDDHDDHDHDEEEAVYGELPNSFLRTDSAALGVSWVGDRGFVGVGYSLFNTRYGVPGHTHAEGDDHGHDDHDHEDEHGEEAHAVHIELDQRRTEVRAGLDDLGVFQSLRFKLARTEYTHTEYEDGLVGTVFDNDSTEARLELTHQPWAGWNGAFGLQASRRDFDAVGAEAFVPQSVTRDLGAFWIAEQSFGALDVELGARYDRNEVEPGQSGNAAYPDREFSAFSVSGGLRWNINEDVHVSLGLDRAQRPPTAEELYSSGYHVATGSHELGDAALDRETANRAEVGLHWHGERLTLDLALYQARYDDFIYLAETGVEDEGIPVRVWNQADARFTGAEIDLQWTFADNDYGTWAARTFADVVRGKLHGSGIRTVDISIPHGHHSHDYSADIALSGNLPRIVPARLGGELLWRSNGGGWRAALGAVYYDSQDDVAEHEVPSDSYTLVHASLAWHLDTPAGNAWEVFVNGNNLLDEEARPHTSFLRNLAPLPGRNVTAGIRLFF